MENVRFGDWLLEQMRLKGNLSYRQVAERLGVSTSLVGKWATNKGTPQSSEHFAALQSLFGVDSAEIARIAGRIPPQRRFEDLSLEDMITVIQSKVGRVGIAQNVTRVASAGPGSPSDTVFRPLGDSRELEFFQVTGDCLEPEIRPGDIVWVDPDAYWRHGSIVAVTNKDGSVSVKRYEGDYVTSNHGQIPLSEVTIIGVVVEWTRKAP